MKPRLFNVLVILLILFQSMAPVPAMAYVATDQDDYAPGSVVTIFGDNRDDAGFLPGETIQVEVWGPNGYHAFCDPAPVADENGAWVCQVTLWPGPEAFGDYVYTATGLTSGVSQSGAFTDGGATITGYVRDSSNNPIAGATVQCTSGCNQQDSTTTDASGFYSLTFQFGGNTASVTLTASKTGYSSSSITRSVSNGQTYPNNNFSLVSTCTPPTISVHPVSQTKTVGEAVSFSVTASGTAPLSYQWRKGGSNVGTNSSTFSIASVLTSDAGSYDVVVSNACGSVTSNAATLTVNKATATVTLSNLTQTYTGSPLSPTATTTPAGLAIVWTNAPQTNAGSYAVTATINDPNYQGSASGTFVINKAGATITLSGLAHTYDGTPKSATAVTTPPGLSVSITYDGLSTPPTNAGSYAVVATITDANYSGSASGTLIIGKAATTTKVTCGVGPFTYNGAAQTPCLAVVTGPGGLNQSLTVTYANNVNAGTATARATYAGDDNYLPSDDTATFTIKKADATCTISGYTGVYDAAYHGASGSCVGVMEETLEGLNLGETFKDVPGGTAYWTFTGNGNYNDQSGSVAIVINKRPVTVTADAKSKVYGDADPALTYQITSGSLVGSDAFTGALTRAAGEDVGVYAIQQGTLALSGNYDLTFIGANLTITKALLTVTADNQSIVFGQSLPVFTFQYSGFKFSDGASVIDTPPTCSVGAIPSFGTYPIVCGGGADNNYAFTYVNGTLTVQAWTIQGFFQPVDMGNVLNTVKNGSTVPLKFRIFAGGTELTDVSAVKSLTYQEISCAALAGAPEDTIETLAATGGTVLRYSDGQFIFNWKTPSKAGKCYQVKMTALDGSFITAFFKLK